MGLFFAQNRISWILYINTYNFAEGTKSIRFPLGLPICEYNDKKICKQNCQKIYENLYLHKLIMQNGLFSQIESSNKVTNQNKK